MSPRAPLSETKNEVEPDGEGERLEVDAVAATKHHRSDGTAALSCEAIKVLPRADTPRVPVAVSNTSPQNSSSGPAPDADNSFTLAPPHVLEDGSFTHAAIV